MMIGDFNMGFGGIFMWVFWFFWILVIVWAVVIVGLQGDQGIYQYNGKNATAFVIASQKHL